MDEIAKLSTYEIQVLLVSLLVCAFGGILIVAPIFWVIGRRVSVPAPFGVDAAAWAEAVSVPSSLPGVILGVLERSLFFIAIWAQSPIVVGAWLAFKVATKWEAWTNVIKVPTELEGIDQIEYLHAKRTWGSLVFMRFLIGTLINLLIAFAAVFVAARMIGSG